MSNKLTPTEREHSRNPELIEAVLNTTFTNDIYDITFKKISPNVVRGAFKNKANGEPYECNFGLPDKMDGKFVRGEACAFIKLL